MVNGNRPCVWLSTSVDIWTPLGVMCTSGKHTTCGRYEVVLGGMVYAMYICERGQGWPLGFFDNFGWFERKRGHVPHGVQNMNKIEQNITQITKEMLGLTFAEGVTIEQTRSIRASGDTYWTDDVTDIVEKDIKKDYGEKHTKQARYEVYENRMHKVTFRMILDGDTIDNQIKYAFSELVIKAQAKTRPEIAKVGDDEFAKTLEKNNGMLEFRTVTDFEPQNRAATTADKAVSAINKTVDLDELENLERILAEQKKKILMQRNNVK